MIAAASASASVPHLLVGASVRVAADPKPKLSYRHRHRPLRISASAHVPSSAERPSPSSSSSLYDVLGIPMGATGADIKAAYRRLARTCHPDVAAAAAASDGSSAADQFMRIHAAYSTLSDPERRAEYDRTVLLLRRRAPPGPTFCSPSFRGYYPSKRTWETDQCW